MKKFSEWDSLSLGEQVRRQHVNFKETFGSIDRHSDHKIPELGEMDEMFGYRIGFRDGALIYAGKPWPVLAPVVPIEERCGCVMRDLGFEDGWRAVAGRVWRPNFHSIIYAWASRNLNLPFTPFMGCEYTKEFAEAGGMAACERWGGIVL